jgi:hypothetical protein
MKKLQEKRLRLNRETVLRLERLMPVRGAAGQVVGIGPTNPPPETSPLCVSTCCGGCDTQVQ